MAAKISRGLRHWEITREMGRLRFILEYGILRFGLLMFVSMTFFVEPRAGWLAFDCEMDCYLRLHVDSQWFRNCLVLMGLLGEKVQEIYGRGRAERALEATQPPDQRRAGISFRSKSHVAPPRDFSSCQPIPMFGILRKCLPSYFYICRPPTSPPDQTE
jgi:hypothetical protein